MGAVGRRGDRRPSLGRVGLGAALVVAPERTTATWIGSDAARPGTQVVATAMGVRDLALGAGAAAALWRGDGARPWVRAGAVADVVDLVATLRAREHLPRLAVAAVGLLAAGSAVLGAYLQTVVD